MYRNDVLSAIGLDLENAMGCGVVEMEEWGTCFEGGKFGADFCDGRTFVVLLETPQQLPSPSSAVQHHYLSLLTRFPFRGLLTKGC
jgi:hypothetical protein